MPARKVLISITSASATLFDGKETTGLFIVEALHPYKALVAAGFEVDLASETGSYTADWLSQQPDFLNGEDLDIWNNVSSVVFCLVSCLAVYWARRQVWY